LFQPAFQTGLLLTAALVLRRVVFRFIPQSVVRLKVRMNR
jgi:hypothetical protein